MVTCTICDKILNNFDEIYYFPGYGEVCEDCYSNLVGDIDQNELD